ncbi:hypothetical protein [Microtetraspora niveoalba]|uniref:hypothetical protein n=1 Tax=Microtetraspora niveoalba TaxID=46175 RepID=UPI000831E33A|nr:hypothetical protein [Microtetraspora niveoalba]
MRRGKTPAAAGYVLTAVLAGVLTGCGMLPGQQGGGGEERQPVAQGKQAAGSGDAAASGSSGDSTGSAGSVASTADGGGDAGAAGQGSAPAEQGTVIARRDVKASGADLTVEITGLKRQGRLATLTWTVTNTGAKRWQMSSGMGDTPGGLGLTVAGVNLVDPVNGKRYTVARTGAYPHAKCLCSDYDVFTEPGEVLPLHATFAAPPPDVTKINVDLRVLGVFTDVPIA